MNTFLAKKFLPIVLGCAILLCSLCFFMPKNCVFAEEAESSVGFESALSSIVTDLERGQVLLAKNSEEQFDCVAEYNLCVCLIAAEKLELTQKIQCTETTISADENFTYKIGSSHTVQSLLSTAILGNADNAVGLLASAIEKNAGNDILTILNAFARENKLENTVFLSKTATTTTFDIAKTIRIATSNATFKGIFCMAYAAGPDGELVASSNRIVFSDTEETYGGFKYGDISAFICQNEEHDLVFVLRGISDENYVAVEENMRDYIFENYTKKALVSEGDTVISVPIASGSSRTIDYVACNTINIYFANSESSDFVDTFSTSFSYFEGFSPESDLVLPITKGAFVGSVTYTLNDNTQINVNLRAGETVRSQNSILDSLQNSFYEYTALYFIVFAVALIGISIGILRHWEEN